MKIAFIVGAFPELSTTFILGQVTGLMDRGHEVHIFARTPAPGERVHADFERYQLAPRTHHWWNKKAQWRDLCVRTFQLLCAKPIQHGVAMLRAFNVFEHRLQVFRLWSYSSMLLRHGPFDVVLAQFGTNGRMAQTLRSLGAFDAPLATTWLGYDLTRIVRAHGPEYYRELFAHGDLHLPLSEDFRARLTALGCPADKQYIHRVGVNLAHFPFIPRTLEANATVRIVSVCRLVEKKGLRFALQALAKVAATSARFDYQLIGDGPERELLKRLCDELGLADRVTFHSARPHDEVRVIMDSSHVYLAPSVTAQDGDEEGMPAAIMEAMANGLPVVSTFHAGIPDLIADGISGLLVPERDVDQLADRIARLIAQPQLWPSLGRAARATIEERFNLARLNDELSDLLTDLAANYPRARPS